MEEYLSSKFDVTFELDLFSCDLVWWVKKSYTNLNVKTSWKKNGFHEKQGNDKE